MYCEKTMPEATYREILARLRVQGYDPKAFVMVPQSLSQLPPTRRSCFSRTKILLHAALQLSDAGLIRACPFSRVHTATETEQPTSKPSILHRIGVTIRQWFDSDHFPEGAEAVRSRPEQFEWRRCLPFAFLHIGCIGVIWVGWSWTAA